MSKVKLLIVDDSNFMRRVLRRSLGTDPNLTIVGEAADGFEALKMIKELQPDVVTLDVEMPGISGLETLRRIMTDHPVPVVMLSAHTTRGAKATMEALAGGAVDFVAKPEQASEFSAMVHSLKIKLRVASGAHHYAEPREKRGLRGRTPRQRGTYRPTTRRPTGKAAGGLGTTSSATAGRTAGRPKRTVGDPSGRIVVIGCSTGGPAALHKIIPRLPADLPAPVVIVQHIPVGFSASLAEHLAMKSAIKVKHAEDGDRVIPGQVLMAPSGYCFRFVRRGAEVVVDLEKDSPPPGGFRPSVDGVMTSAAELYGAKAIGFLLTGMGRDGAQGMLEIKKRGGVTVAEHESTCVVYGMPKAAYDLGAADKMLPLNRMVAEITGIL